jgi:hypothetical protein
MINRPVSNCITIHGMENLNICRASACKFAGKSRIVPVYALTLTQSAGIIQQCQNGRTPYLCNSQELILHQLSDSL